MPGSEWPVFTLRTPFRTVRVPWLWRHSLRMGSIGLWTEKNSPSRPKPATYGKSVPYIRLKLNQIHLFTENGRYTCILFSLFNTFCNTIKAKIPQLHWNNAICIYIHYRTKEIKKIIYCPNNRTAGRTQRPTHGQGGQTVIFLMPFLDKKIFSSL